MSGIFFRTESINALSARLAAIEILIADSDVRIANLVRDIVSQLGFRNIHVVHDGNEATEVMNARSIDLVITDWKMIPQDGINFVKFLRSHADPKYRRVPIIMLTGKGEKADVEIARDAGINEFIVKPFHARTLLDRLVMLVEQPRNFIIAKDFKGPDRRRRMAIEGEDRRDPRPQQPKQFMHASDQNAGEDGEAKFVVLAPDYGLKRKIGEDVNIRDILLPEVLRSVQEVIDRTQPMFLTWVAQDFADLERIFQHSQKGEAEARESAPVVQQLSFGIKSQAGIFGYSLASTVARLLYNFVERATVFDDNYLLVVKQHVDALRGIFQLSVEGDGAQMGRELQVSLSKLASKYDAIHAH